MTQLGARGETAAQITEALGISRSAETLHDGCAEIIHRLSAAAGRGHEMAAANSLWGEDGAPFMPEFLDRISRDYEPLPRSHSRPDPREFRFERWLLDTSFADRYDPPNQGRKVIKAPTVPRNNPHPNQLPKE